MWGAIPDGDALYVHPMGLAAWFGLLATALNLFPFGQLDGGHITYALFGRRARWLSAATIIGTVALAIGSLSWAAWAVLMVGMTAVHGIGHPPTGDDAQPLGRVRIALAVVAALVFVLSFTPAPDRTDGTTPGARDRGRDRARTRPTLIVAVRRLSSAASPGPWSRSRSPL